MMMIVVYRANVLIESGIPKHNLV